MNIWLIMGDGEYTKEYFWNPKTMDFTSEYTKIYCSDSQSLEEDFGKIPRSIPVRIVKFVIEKEENE